MDNIERNVAVLKRLRDMLTRQREKFGSYLRLLECEGEAIEKGDSEKLLALVEMEQSIIAEVFTLKKVIAPLESLYEASYPAGTEATIPRLKSVLETLGAEILAHNGRNRQKLRERMEDMRREITSLRAWPKTASPYVEVTPGLIDITT
ncbi:MAG: flagellar biosynthesis protein FlgN [Spirochaetia bacterium]